MDNVLKVDFWDVDKMSEDILTLIEYPQMASEIAKLAKKEAAGLTWNKAALKTVQVYQELL